MCGLFVYANELAKEHGLTGGQTWSLKELLASLPDCYEDIIACYGAAAQPYCVPLESLIDLSHRAIDRINLAEVPNAEQLLQSVPRLRERYLQPQKTEGDLLVLRPKLGRSSDISQASLSGRRFLTLVHEKSGQVELPQILIMFMAMFILGTLSRYYPVVWTNFVANRKTAERHLIDVFCRVAIRQFPNLALNLIRNQNLIFTSARYAATDMRSFAVADDVKRIVSQELDTTLQTLFSRAQT